MEAVGFDDAGNAEGKRDEANDGSSVGEADGGDGGARKKEGGKKGKKGRR